MSEDIEGVVDERPDDADPGTPEPEPLPEHKDDLVALAIDRGTPSYKAWAMTVPDLKTLLTEA